MKVQISTCQKNLGDDILEPTVAGVIGEFMRLWVFFAVLFPSLTIAQPVTISVPSVAVTRVDHPIAFSTAGFDAPIVSGIQDEAVRISVDQGVMTLASVDGLEFTTGDGNSDSTMGFQGAENQVNSALDGLIYSPPMGFAGRAEITLAVGNNSARWFVTVNAPIDSNAARDAILNGVQSIHGGGGPGHMVAFGEDAHEIALYADGVISGAVIIAAGWGSGRVVALPDHQILNMDAYSDESGRFFRNTLAWFTGDRFNLEIVTLSANVGQWLVDQGFTRVTVTNPAGLSQALETAALFIPPWLGAQVADNVLDTIGHFVRRGGGLFICDYGIGYNWWWGLPIYQAPGNRLLRRAGIGFVGGHLWQDGVVDITPAAGQLSADDLTGILAAPDGVEDGRLQRAGVLLGRIYDALPPADPLVSRLDSAFGQAVDSIRPTPETPTRSSFAKALLKREISQLRQLEPDQIPAHRTANAIFGRVPDDAPRVEKTITIDPAQTRWHSTGLYAAPGDLIVLTTTNDVVDAGFQLRIGGHTDDISPREAWKRPPQVHWAFPINGEMIEAASPFGGALYVDVGTENRDLAPFDVTLVGAVNAPYFQLGTTQDDDWNNGIKNAPAPYAELVSERLTISLPSHLVRTLENPSEVMIFWNDVVRFQDELGGHAERRYMAERINIDVQVSAGYLHAGYPTQGPLVSAKEIVDLSHLRRTGSWGWFHELGHEAQRRPDKSWGWDNAYTFDGSVEATVNIFTVYAYDQLGIEEQGGWSWTAAANTVMQQAIAGLVDGNYTSLSVNYKLAMFLQLRDHFGWDVFLRIFSRYNQDGIDLPQGDAAERDQWLVWMSEVVEHNLTNFFEGVWGLQFSQHAKNQVAGLPTWLPAVGGLSGRFMTQPNRALSFDLAGRGLSHDGTAELVDLTNPEHGTIDFVDGLWVYTPNQDFLGQDQFTYGIRSSTGHVHTSTIDIDVSHHGVRMDMWTDIPGSELTDLTGADTYPNQPDRTSVIKTLASPVNQLDDYGVRLGAYLIPSNDGEYTFWIASDDQGELWLSPNSRKADLIKIARVANYTGPQDWTATPEQRSEPVALVAGDAYYIEALMKEGGGGDHLAIAWSRAEANPSIIPSENVFISLPEQPNGDAGVPLDDANVPSHDASVTADATRGSGPDAEDTMDRSVVGDAMANGPSNDETQSNTESGCACHSGGGNGDSFWVFILVGMGVVRRRVRTLNATCS
ncbi:MAG: hypothetical protein CMH52_06420 [Myxococcales bacterium]|nr:hypothetical protein [Myxococcales bacterium]